LAQPALRDDDGALLWRIDQGPAKRTKSGITLWSEVRALLEDPEQTGRMNRSIDGRSDLY
jgi:hypothetical protein